MDTEHLMAHLIDGSLITILNAGTDSRNVSLIVRDDKSPSGLRIMYQPHKDEHGNLVGDHVTPQEATNGTKVIKKEQVADYLIESFGLTDVQARRVVNEAHAMPLAS
jgi:hypothetical protein